MARGGINKVNVQEARQVLLSKGMRPTIDAIRVELGNTGSKTTISRYLKEIEQEEDTRLDDETLLNNGLTAHIKKLASMLHSEASSIVENNNEKHAQQVKQFIEEIGQLKATIDKFTQSNQAFKKQIDNNNQIIDSQNETIQQLKLDLTESQEKSKQLEQRLTDKGNHIQSLEEKHQHARDALNHYRASVKEQREQDQRAHEHQVQQLQVEQRKLNQTLIVKQDEITRLNSDNGRLNTQVSNLQKENRSFSQKLSQLESQLTIKQENEIKTSSKIEHLNDSNKSQSLMVVQLEKQLKQLTSKNKKLEKSLLEANTELKTTTKIFDNLQSHLRA